MLLNDPLHICMTFFLTVHDEDSSAIREFDFIIRVYLVDPFSNTIIARKMDTAAVSKTHLYLGVCILLHYKHI